MSIIKLLPMKHLVARIALASAIVACPAMTAAQVSGTLAELAPAALTNVGYKTVAEALAALKAMPGATVNDAIPATWVVIEEPEGRGVWSFTPASHYAFPAVVKRRVALRADASVLIETGVLCEAQKAACESLVKEFAALEPGIRAWLATYEKALLRSPFYDAKSRMEAMASLQSELAGPPIDDIDDFMTPERAEFVRKLRVDEGYTYRALARACAREWGANWGSNQLVGEDLWRASAKILGLPLN